MNSGLGTVGPGIDSYIEYLMKGYSLFGDKELFDQFSTDADTIFRSQYYQGSFLAVNPRNGMFVFDRPFSGLQFFYPLLSLYEGYVRDALEIYASNIDVVSVCLAQPEAYFIAKNQIVFSDASYPLRPEFIEATYSLYRVTHEPIFVKVCFLRHVFVLFFRNHYLLF